MSTGLTANAGSDDRTAISVELPLLASRVLFIVGLAQGLTGSSSAFLAYEEEREWDRDKEKSRGRKFGIGRRIHHGEKGGVHQKKYERERSGERTYQGNHHKRCWRLGLNGTQKKTYAPQSVNGCHYSLFSKTAPWRGSSESLPQQSVPRKHQTPPIKDTQAPHCK